MLNVLRYGALGADGIANPYVQGGSQGKQQVTVPLTGAGSDFAIGFSQTGTGGYVKIDNVVDNRIIRRLDESGFIDKAYAAQGMSSKP